MADPRTVLLARPGQARERLRAALEQAGVEVVLEADPLDTDIQQIRSADAPNVVIAVDAETEDALDRFDAILADDAYRILFEEVALVQARDGWDAARWSRHLGAKLLGHGDVLPEGHEPDDMPQDLPDDDTTDATSTDGDIEAPGFRLEEEVAAERMPDDVVADATDGVSTDDDVETFGFQLEEMTAEAETEIEDQPVDHAAAAELPTPAADAGLDWTRFQDFEAINELPAANAPQAAETDFRAALAPLDASDLQEEEAYERLEEALSSFDAAAPADRWQDFERPVADVETPAIEVEADSVTPPAAPTDWSLTDEPLPAGESRDAASDDQLAKLEDRIAGLSLVDDTVASIASEGAVLLVGGIGGPDPLRQILQQLDKDFSVPVLVQQWLDGGQYGRLVRQMDRASQMPVVLAEAGKPLQAGCVYIVPTAITVQRAADGAMHFVDDAARGFADVLSALPPGTSGVVLLSGTSEDFVEPAQRFQQAGGRLFAQAAEGCYDHAVPALLIQRGAEAHSPAGLATQLAARWQQQVPA